MFTIKFETPFTQQEQLTIRAACEKTKKMSSDAFHAVSTGKDDIKEQHRRVQWFGTQPPLEPPVEPQLKKHLEEMWLKRVAEGVRKMDAFIQDQGKTVRFIPADRPSYQGLAAAAQPSWPVPTDDIASVKTLPNAHISGVAHVGSGVRISLGDTFFLKTDADQAATIYHELTHKILASRDFVYDIGNCRALAKKYPEDAINNADNWAYYASSFIHNWP